MCWNSPVSWTSFVLGTIFNIYFALIVPMTYKIWFVFFQLIITVQLGEALIWDGTYPEVGTYIAFFSVWLQPLMLSILLYYYNVHPVLQYIMYGLVSVYILSSFSSIATIKENVYRPVLCGDDRYHIDFIAWGGNRIMGYLYMISSLYAIICLFSRFYIISAYLFITLFISLLFYSRTFASLWCWFAVFSPIVYYLGTNMG